MDTKNTYVSVENINKCKCCKREQDLRMGYCFDCAEAQSILIEGKDMYDKGNAKTSFEKLEMLIEKGWTPPSDERSQIIN
jgi:hypothetical protein